MRRDDERSSSAPVTETAAPRPGVGVGDPVPGALLAGRFVVRRRLGAGATGVVFEAHDSVVGQAVAVKLLHPVFDDRASRERVRREVRAARPGHQNLVSIFELHEAAGRSLLSMELVVGRSLREELQERGTLPWQDVTGIGRQMAAALSHLHARGVIHRDVKPSNIMLASDGTAKLCDLGLARPTDHGMTVTSTEVVVGTPAYMAPEQGRGRLLTPACDIYSLGLTLVCALTGRVPLEGETPLDTLMLRHRGRPLRVRSSGVACPRWLDRLLRRMLEPDPRDRPGAEEVEAALERRVYGLRPSGRLVRSWLRAAFVLGVAAAVAGFLWSRRAPVALDPSSPLGFDVHPYVGDTVVAISDADGHRLASVGLGGEWNPRDRRNHLHDRVAFGDFDGDGRQDVAVARFRTAFQRPLAILLRRADGTLAAPAEVATELEFTYDGRSFSRFQPKDIAAADLTGDGRSEIILALASSPYYPSALRVIEADGSPVFTLWHPGVLKYLQIGDRDADGVPEVYVGGTCNFLTPPESNTSAPVLVAVEADWRRMGREVTLFAPGRRLATSVPHGVELMYLSWKRINLERYHNAWQHALVQPPRDDGSGVYLSVIASQETDLGLLETTGNRWGLRDIFLDRHLAPVLAQWEPSTAEALGIDPGSAASRALLETRYWDGVDWVTAPTVVPVGESAGRSVLDGRPSSAS